MVTYSGYVSNGPGSVDGSGNATFVVPLAARHCAVTQPVVHLESNKIMADKQLAEAEARIEAEISSQQARPSDETDVARKCSGRQWSI